MDITTLSRLFANPPAAYRPMMFWLWNGDITPAGIEEQIADFAAKGCGGFFIHPMGENFRLKDFVQGMSPPYLSEEYFRLVRHAVETAATHGLYAWLYDEGGWPSGTAQGHVIEGHPEFRGKRLHARRISSVDISGLPEHLVAAVGLPEIGIPEPIDLREVAQGLWPYEEIIIFYSADDGFPVDVLNPAAVRRFIDLTHEQYAQVVGDFFGTTIPGIFTDETSLGGRLGGDAIPWFAGMLEALGRQIGRNAWAYLPLLFSPDRIGQDVFGRYSDHEVIAARCEYYDLLTRRFGESYWQQISDWCAEHGLIHTGHVPGEDNLPDHLHFGHFFRTTGALHLPGVDTIWRQLFPGKDNFPYPRFAASAARQNNVQDAARPTPPVPTLPNPWADAVLTETNAVYGFGLHYGLMRWLMDYQAQHGINLFAPMASYYDTTGGRIYGTMSHVGPGNPLWPYYRSFADYAGRVCLLARQGYEPARVAVYYPIEAAWSLSGMDEAWQSLQAVCSALSARHIPFDFIDADFLQKLSVDVGRGYCEELSYETFIVPAVSAMPSAAAAKLAELREAAANVVVLEHWPFQAADMNGLQVFEQAVNRLQEAGATVTSAHDLGRALAEIHSPNLELLAPEPDLLLTSRTLGGDHLMLLTNNSPDSIEPELAFDLIGPVALEVWDLRDGEIAPLPWKLDRHPQQFQPVLPPWSTMALALRGLPSGQHPAEREWPEVALDLQRWLSDPAHRRGLPPADVAAEFESADRAIVMSQYLLEEGEVRLVDPEDFPVPYATEGEVPLWDWARWPLVDFSGHIRYEFELVVAEELLHRQLLLVLGEVFWTARVEINGEELAELLWAPYAVDVTGRLRAGSNRLAITVSNTLAPQVCRPDSVAEARERGWCNPYLERTLPMMAEDLRSGLIGPVRLIIVPAD